MFFENADDDNPMVLFEDWYRLAMQGEPHNPNAMALASADAQGRPSNRMVLMKHYNDQGFTFYTNLESHKGRDIAENPYVAACFYWKSLDRQIRIEGVCEKVSNKKADLYFATRHPRSRIGAIESKQSRIMEDRELFESRIARLERRHPDDDIPRPVHWSGYCIRPYVIEFWEECENRLHNRLEYRRESLDEAWQMHMLYP